MNILLVDNDTDTLQELQDLCARCGYKATTIHCSRLDGLQTTQYDVAVLSGGYWYDDAYKHLETYRAEIELIKQAPVPIFGICIGMQLMQVAVNGTVPRLDQPHSGLRPIAITRHGQELLGLGSTVTVHKNHTLGVVSLSPEFELLGTSPGHAEIIKHRTKPLFGVQFHPEIGDPIAMADLFKHLMEYTVSLKPKA